MHRVTLATFIFLALAGCSQTEDDGENPTARAAKLEAFVKPGIDWTEVATAFPPDKYSVALTDPKDPTQRIGGTPYSAYDQGELREFLERGHDGFTFRYELSEEPIAFYETHFDRHGKYETMSKVGKVD